MGNSNNKMTRSCVPSSTGSDKNVKTMDERIDALVLRLHEVYSYALDRLVRRLLFAFEFSNILKDFSRVKVVSVSRRLLKARVSKIGCYSPRGLFKRRWSSRTGSASEKEKQPAGGFRLRVVRLFLFSPNDRPKKGSKLTKIFSSKNLSS